MNYKNTNNDILKAGKELCDSNFINSISNLHIYPILIGTFILWCQIIFAWYIALYLPLYFSFISLIIISACHQAIVLWVHEGSHRLFQNRKLNDLWVNFFFATPLGATVETYRANHLTHHAYLASEKDLDRWEFAFDIKGQNFPKVIFKSLTGMYIFQTLQKYLNNKSINKIQYSRILMSAFWNLTLLWLCIVHERWYLYFLLWLIPLFTITKCLIIIRATAEHQPADYKINSNSFTPMKETIRTTIPTWWTKWIFYQANFNYHVEHHMFPNIPFYNLPKLHKYLVERKFYERFPDCLQSSPINRLNELSNSIIDTKVRRLQPQ